MPKLRELSLASHLKERLVQGHPWVYRNHVSPDFKLATGEWVKVRCGSWTGFGLWDNKGPIALRIYSHKQLPDPRWLKHQVQLAWELRSPLRHQGCTAYRWLFGEGDGLPGITVDLYSEFAVVQTYMESAITLLDWLIPALKATTSLQGILLRSQHHLESATEMEEAKTRLLWGKAPPEDLVVQEYDLRFGVDLQTGQKTGLFLDQRENRRYLQSISSGRSVLNCFAYTGAFSLYALQGGASHVTSVDIGKGLAEAAAKNLHLNRLDPNRHSFVTADCFEVLNRSAQEGQTYDLVILDPPSFAKTKQNRHAALRAYTKLNALALKSVVPNGYLVTASCTSQISPEAFKEMLASASAQAGDRIQLIHEAGQPLDHPVPAHFPEGRYLKFVVGRVCAAA